MFYLTTLSKHFIYDYMASGIKIIQTVFEETRYRHYTGYSFQLGWRVGGEVCVCGGGWWWTFYMPIST